MYLKHIPYQISLFISTSEQHVHVYYALLMITGFLSYCFIRGTTKLNKQKTQTQSSPSVNLVNMHFPFSIQKPTAEACANLLTNSRQINLLLQESTNFRYPQSLRLSVL